MSVTQLNPRQIGAMAYVVMSNNNYRSAFEIARDKLESQCLGMDYADEGNRIKAFFDRAYIANQLAFYLTYPRDCAKDGSFAVKRLHDKDIQISAGVTGPRRLNGELRHLRYNLISNGGRSFFDEQDSQRLDQLIEYTANEIIDLTDPDRAVC